MPTLLRRIPRAPMPPVAPDCSGISQSHGLRSETQSTEDALLPQRHDESRSWDDSEQNFRESDHKGNSGNLAVFIVPAFVAPHSVNSLVVTLALCRQPLANLFINCLQHFIHNLPCEPINRYMHPVSLFASNNEFTGISLTMTIPAGLCNHVDHEIPYARHSDF